MSLVVALPGSNFYLPSFLVGGSPTLLLGVGRVKEGGRLALVRRMSAVG